MTPLHYLGIRAHLSLKKQKGEEERLESTMFSTQKGIGPLEQYLEGQQKSTTSAPPPPPRAGIGSE
jgi:hypothetical protein